MTRSHERAKLLARIRRRYDIVTRDLRVGELVVPFTQIKDPDTVLDEVVAEADRREKIRGRPEHEDELHLPYWAELWDSAFGVAQHLVTPQSAIRHPQSVLDLGCGMGLAGTVAAALGHEVMLADVESESLLFARLNAMRYPRVRVRRLDWRRDRLSDRFDLILGADVLYDKAQWEFLEAFWQAHLREGGSVILGEPGRQTGEMFVDWIGGKNWKLQRAEEKVATREKPIRLFRLLR